MLLQPVLLGPGPQRWALIPIWHRLALHCSKVEPPQQNSIHETVAVGKEFRQGLQVRI